MRVFDMALLRKLPRRVIIFWVGFALVVLVCTLQEATQLFYGPQRVLYAHKATVTGTVSDAWVENFGFLLFPAAWLLAWCAMRVRAAILVGLACLIAVFTWIFIAFEVIGQNGSTSYGWTFTGETGRGLAGWFSNELMLRFLLDPAGGMGAVLMVVGILSFPALFIFGEFYAWNRTARPGFYCSVCAYNLRGTPSGLCPECGHQNPPQLLKRDG